MRPRMMSAVAVLVLGLIVGGCGDDDGTATTLEGTLTSTG